MALCKVKLKKNSQKLVAYRNVLPPGSFPIYSYPSILPTSFPITTLNIHCHALSLLQSHPLPALLAAASSTPYKSPSVCPLTVCSDYSGCIGFMPIFCPPWECSSATWLAGSSSHIWALHPAALRYDQEFVDPVLVYGPYETPNQWAALVN